MSIRTVFILFSGLAAMTLPLTGCNLANSADYKEPEPQTYATAEISFVSATPSAKSTKLYEENTLLTVNTAGSGSYGSTYTCELTVSRKALSSTANYIQIGTYNSCDTHDVALDYGAGNYKFTLVVTDANKKTAEVTQVLTVDPVDLTDIPNLKADFVATVGTVATENGFDIALDASSSERGDAQSILEYTWQIRKKQENKLVDADKVGPLNSPYTSVVVQNDGIYFITLSVLDSDSRVSSISKTVVVEGSGNTLVPDFTVTYTGTAPTLLQVDASISTVTEPDHYLWELWKVDAITAPAYTLETESPIAYIPVSVLGNYFVVLNLIDKSGNEHKVTQVIEVN